MSAEFEEQLSSLIDGEMSSDASRFVLRRLETSSELKQSWSRVHLAGDLLARRSVLPASSRFAERIAKALEVESLASPAKAGNAGWLRYAGGAALAASVAVVALMMVPAPNTTDTTPPVLAVEREAPRTQSVELITSAPRSQALQRSEVAALGGYRQGRIPVLPALVVVQSNLSSGSGHVAVPQGPVLYTTAPQEINEEALEAGSMDRVDDETRTP